MKDQTDKLTTLKKETLDGINRLLAEFHTEFVNLTGASNRNAGYVVSLKPARREWSYLLDRNDPPKVLDLALLHDEPATADISITIKL